MSTAWGAADEQHSGGGAVGSRMRGRVRRSDGGQAGDRGWSGSCLFWKPTGLDGFWIERFSDFRKLKKIHPLQETVQSTNTIQVQCNLWTSTLSTEDQGPKSLPARFRHRPSLSIKGMKKELPFVKFCGFQNWDKRWQSLQKSNAKIRCQR